MKCLLKYRWVKLPRAQIPEGKGILIGDISRQCEPVVKAVVGQLHSILLVGLGPP